MDSPNSRLSSFKKKTRSNVFSARNKRRRLDKESPLLRFAIDKGHVGGHSSEVVDGEVVLGVVEVINELYELRDCWLF